MVKTRFAPSPTGYIHVGNVRTALYTYLVARKNKGKFILRIEDTDQSRLVEGAEELILDTLKWLGLEWDGEIVRQTSRKDIYLDYASKLIEKGLAYADPYSKEEVEEFREQAKQAKKAFLYRDYRPENPPFWRLGMPLRFKVPELKRYEWDDAVMGHLSAGEEALDDFVLIKADGLPTYNFAHIVDDYEMGITHVIRGAEYISSTPKYLSLYKALEIEPPVLAHVPHILAPTGNKKLGKRDGAKSIAEYRNEGYLPEAVLNFLAQLGWNDGTEQEIFSKNELIQKFSLDRVQKSGARFDEKRLVWLNGQWIRSLNLDDLYQRCKPFWESGDEIYKKKVLALAQDRLKTLSDLPALTSYFFEEPEIDMKLITENKQLKRLTDNELKHLLRASESALDRLDEWTSKAIQSCLNSLLEELKTKPSVLFSLVRIATTWAPFSPQLNETLALVGKKRTLLRLHRLLDSL
jgi:glutamyl-tRNA synthetase|nr:MAG TPA: glutamyl-tRNA synthetase [Bacteriophage sp.]